MEYTYIVVFDDGEVMKCGAEHLPDFIKPWEDGYNVLLRVDSVGTCEELTSIGDKNAENFLEQLNWVKPTQVEQKNNDN